MAQQLCARVAWWESPFLLCPHLVTGYSGPGRKRGARWRGSEEKPPQQRQEPESQPTSTDDPAPPSQSSWTLLKTAAGAAALGTLPSPATSTLPALPLHSFTEHILPELSIYQSDNAFLQARAFRHKDRPLCLVWYLTQRTEQSQEAREEPKTPVRRAGQETAVVTLGSHHGSNEHGQMLNIWVNKGMKGLIK